MKPKSNIIFSIVVLTYNREKFIENCLKTLTTLDFPKDKYEIIVVDDGSTDRTVSIIKKFPVRLIQHKKNKGIPAGRNTGLKHAKGEIYVCFDDDCFVSKEWLQRIADAYKALKKEKVSGLSGLIMPTSKQSLVDKYMTDTDYGNPSPAYFGKSRNPIQRFATYIKSMFVTKQEVKDDIYEVGEIWGANCSFPVEVLKGVGGWDESLSGVEDTDICYRIKKKYNDRKFFCTKNAVLYHDHRLTVKSLMEKPLSRGISYFNFYRKKHTFPPIFPFPLLTLAVAAISILINPLLALASILLMPQLLYSWWIMRAVKEHRPYQLLFPYLQVGYEFFTILGLSRGFFKSIHFTSQRFTLLLLLAFGIETNVLTLFGINNFYSATISSLLFLLFIPGMLLLWSLRVKFASLWEFFVQSVGLSILMVMFVGLITNYLLPLLVPFFIFSPVPLSTSAIKPLTTLPILFSLDSVLVLLWLYSFARNLFLHFDNAKLSFSWQTTLLAFTSLLFPALAIIGAFSLNNNMSNTFTMIMLGAIAAYVMLLTIFRNYINESIYPFSLFTIALSLLFMTSLRGWYITGHDIFLEYFVFQLTKSHGIWQMANFQDPYNACLSITILPTIISNITHINDLYIYKLIYQILFSTSIMTTYLFIKRFINPFLAFLATFTIVSLPTFMTDMPMLNRQEIALLFFALTLFTLFNQQLSTLKKWILFVLYGIGMLLSHYSTTYIAMALFTGGFLLYIPLHLSRLHVSIKQFVRKIEAILGFVESKQNLRWEAILILLIATILWNTSITNTAKGITTTLSNVAKDLTTHTLTKAKNDPSAYGLLNNKPQSPQVQLDNYVTTLTAYVRKFNDDSAFLDKAIYSQYKVTIGSQVKLNVTNIGKALQQAHINVFAFNDDLKQVYARVIQLFIVIGFIAVFLFRKHISNFEKEYYILAITFFAILVFEIILPGGSIDYGVLRLFQQGMILFSIPLIMGGLAIFSIFNVFHKDIKVYLLSATIVFFFLYLSGFIPQITGGYYPQLNLANGGFYYDAYYTHTLDKDAMDWLSQNRDKIQPVQSDWFSLKRILTYEDFYSVDGLTPSTIRRNSYVYLGVSNLQLNQFITYINGAPVYYTFPLNILDQNKNLIYNNGGAKIYR